jgi:four helix bundle protein
MDLKICAVSTSMPCGNCNDRARVPGIIRKTSHRCGHVPCTASLGDRTSKSDRARPKVCDGRIRVLRAVSVLFHRRPAAKQFYRASSSAAFNYCAAKRGRSTVEFIAKLGTVVEEIDEAVRWLEHMRDIRLSVDLDLLSEAEQLRRIWGKSLGTARRNEQARQ